MFQKKTFNEQWITINNVQRYIKFHAIQVLMIKKSLENVFMKRLKQLHINWTNERYEMFWYVLQCENQNWVFGL